MAESAHQIKRQITAERDDLGKNLNELESKAKSLTDWRSYFEKNPMALIGAAFGGGILMASVLGGSRGTRGTAIDNLTSRNRVESESTPSRQKQQVMETWENIKSAVVGVAASRFQEFVGEIIPGFHEQLRQTEPRKTT